MIKRIMKKTTSILLCVALIGTMIVGCGKKETTKKNQDDKKEITFMIPDWGNPGEELLAEFEEESGIKVHVQEVSWDDIRDKVSIAAAGGEAAADVVEVDWSWVGEMNSAGWLEPIEMSEADKKDIPTLETFTIDNKVLAVPYANDYRIAYYNVEHFKKAGIEKAPETWDEVYAALKKLKESGVTKYPFTLPVNADESATTSMIWLAFARNGKVFNESGTLSKDTVLDALKFEQKLVKEELIDPAARTFSGMDCYRKLTSGEASFMVGPTKFVGISNNPEESSVVGQIKPILLPGKESTSQVTMPLPEAIGITAFSKHKEEAKEFIKWYSSPEIQKKLYIQNSSIPTRNAVIEELINEGTIKNAGAMLEQAKLIKTPFPKGVPAYYSEMSNTIYNNINKMVLGKLSPEKAFDAMDKKIKELVK